MAGWFPREIHGLDDIRGLSFRTAGLGTEVWRRVGLNVQTLPAAEIVPALQAGSLDAAEWIGPWNDLALGLHRIHKLYYYPSIIEPSTAPEVAVDKSAYAALPEELQTILEVAAGAELHRVLADFNTNNARALEILVHEHAVELRRLPDDVIEALARASAEVVGEIAAYDEISARIVESLAHFRDGAMRWTDVSSQAFAATRRLPVAFPA